MVEEHEADMTDPEKPVGAAQTPAEDAEEPVETAERHVEEAQTPVDEAEMPVETVERVATGHDEIDAAMRRLDELDSLPVDRHGEILDELHGHLRDALAAAASPPSGRSDD